MTNPRYPGKRSDHKTPSRTPGFKTGRLNDARNKVAYPKAKGGNMKNPPPPRKGPCTLSIMLVLSLAIGAHASIAGAAIAYLVA